MQLRNVTRYYPEHMPFGENIQYFIDENGLDFYNSIDTFKLKYKLCIHPDTKVIHSVSEIFQRYIQQALILLNPTVYHMMISFLENINL